MGTVGESGLVLGWNYNWDLLVPSTASGYMAGGLLASDEEDLAKQVKEQQFVHPWRTVADAFDAHHRIIFDNKGWMMRWGCMRYVPEDSLGWAE